MREPFGRTPKMVWLIAICLGAMAVLNIAALTWLLLFDPSSQAARDVRASLTTFDWIALYGLSAILLSSMFLFFRMRKRSINWFTTYIGVGSWAALWYARTPTIEPHFNEIASLGGLIIGCLVLGYMVWLRNRQQLA